MSAIRMRIWTNVRYSDLAGSKMTAIQITEQGLPLATVQSGQNYNYLLDRGQMVYLSDRRTT